MVFLGISILIASITFLCYRHLSRNWFLHKPWRRSHNPAVSNVSNDTIRSIPGVKDQSYDTKETIILNDGQNLVKKEKEKKPLIMLTAATDSNAMPPPPIPRKKISSLSPHVACLKQININPAQIPKITIDNDAQESRDQSILPVFPLKPVLRTSAGIHGPVQHLPSDSKLPSQDLRSTYLALSIPRISAGSSILPNRKPLCLTPTLSQNVLSTKPNQKITLKPGHSPLDWARLSNSKLDLSGLPPGNSYLKIRPSLLKTQTGRKGKKAWTVLGGRVYNITPYLPFHPGGESELLKCAGRDGTELFNNVHPWVNWEGMLSACLVGIVVEEVEVSIENKMNEMD